MTIGKTVLITGANKGIGWCSYEPCFLRTTILHIYDKMDIGSPFIKLVH